MSHERCLACATLHRQVAVPGGVVWEDEHWLADHCLGPFGIGALALKTKVHRESLPEMTSSEADALGPALRTLSDAMVRGLPCERVYVSAWVDKPPPHVHFVLEPRYAEEANVGAWAIQAARREAPLPPSDDCAAAAARIRSALGPATTCDGERAPTVRGSASARVRQAVAAALRALRQRRLR